MALEATEVETRVHRKRSTDSTNRLRYLNNDELIPIIGLGTYNSIEDPGDVSDAVRFAIRNGYRHIDTASIYGNQKQIGRVLHELIDEQKFLKRNEIFVTSKLWNNCHESDQVEQACRDTLAELQLNYLDLYLIHWPFSYKRNCKTLFPFSVDELGDVDYLETWTAMERLVDIGLCRSIGLSNFNCTQIKRVLGKARIKPVINQIELHPYLTQQNLRKFCKENNIVITAYCPLGSPNSLRPNDDLLKDKVILELAAKYDRQPAQICLRYLVDCGIVVIPKSFNQARILENFEIFDFQMDQADICRIDSLNRNDRICKIDSYKFHKYYPFV